MGKDPAWKRMVGGLIGIGIVVAVVLLLRQQGVSRDEVERWEGAIVLAAAAAGVLLWISKRRSSGD